MQSKLEVCGLMPGGRRQSEECGCGRNFEVPVPVTHVGLSAVPAALVTNTSLFLLPVLTSLLTEDSKQSLSDSTAPVLRI